MFFTWIPILALLSNYDQEICLIHVGTGANVLAFLVLARVALAQDSKTLPPPADRDPFVGVWQANGDKSRPKLNKVERSYVRTIGRIGED